MYVIAAQGSAEGPVKLGISLDPDQRLRELQTGHPKRLHVYHRELIEDDIRAGLFERLLHRDNHHTRLAGEWFDLTVEQGIAYIQFTIIEYDLIPTDVLRKRLSSRRPRMRQSEDLPELV